MRNLIPNLKGSFTFVCILTIVYMSLALPIVKRFQPFQSYCFTDDIPQHTLVKIKTKVEAPLHMEIFTGNSQLKNITLNNESTQTFTTQRYGLFKFCFKNPQNVIAFLKYQYAIGLRANDYTSSYDGTDYLKSLQNQARIAQNFITQIQRQNLQGFQIILQGKSEEPTYACVYALSTFFVIISMGMTYIQYKMVRKHLHNRKYL